MGIGQSFDYGLGTINIWGSHDNILNSNWGALDPSQTGGYGNASIYYPDFTITGAYDVPQVPEPATMLLLGSGLLGLAAYGRKKFFKK
jgi:hypothetical protein